MVSYVPQIPVFSLQDNNLRPLENSSFSPIGSPSHNRKHNRHNHDFLPLPTPLPTNSRKSPDILGSPTPHTSYAHPLPSPTHLADSILCPTSAKSRDVKPPPRRGFSSIVLVTPPSPTKNHARSDSSPLSSLVNTLKRIARCVS